MNAAQEALKIEAAAYDVEVKGMQAANQDRILMGRPVVYKEADFQYIVGQLRDIAHQIKNY